MQAMIALSDYRMNGEMVQTVNARDLHIFLEVATRFNDWISSRIEQYGFIENSDFVTFTEKPVKGRPTKEYAITIDVAKELSMVERNAKGRQARQYFIECEKRAKGMEGITPPKRDYMLELLVKEFGKGNIAAAELLRSRYGLTLDVSNQKSKNLSGRKRVEQLSQELALRHQEAQWKSP